MTLESRLRSAIRDVPNYPKPGILFKDIAPVLADPLLVKEIVAAEVAHWKGKSVDAVAGVEARGFIFGAMLAAALEVPFIMIRKKGKLPYKTITQDYVLEYGNATIEMHVDAVKPGWNVLIHDDLLATGGTAAAAGDLVNKMDAHIAGFSFMINLSFLSGAQHLQQRFGVAPFCLVSF